MEKDDMFVSKAVNSPFASFARAIGAWGALMRHRVTCFPICASNILSRVHPAYILVRVPLGQEYVSLKAYDLVSTGKGELERTRR